MPSTPASGADPSTKEVPLSSRALRGSIQREESRFTLIVHTPAGDIPVEVARKRVKNLNLRVRGDGTVTASVPLHASEARAQAFLDRRAAWIASHVLRHRERAELEEHTAYARDYPLWGVLEPIEPLLGGALDGRNIDEAEPNESRAEDVERLVYERYRAELHSALPTVAQRLEARMGVHASAWRVRAMKTRWGSCTPRTGAIRINLRLAAYPPACLEFVVAHELCHLMEPSHNKRFHMLLDIYCPDNRAIATLLKRPARTVARERQQ